MDDTRNVKRFPNGVVVVPPSKSVSHRAVICSCLAEEPGELHNLARSDDVDATHRCMRALLDGSGEPLDCGESGSTLRFLVPLAAAFPGEHVFVGRGRLMERPLGPYLDALSEHGALIALRDRALTVSGPLKPGRYGIPGDISSQFVSGLLLALPLLSGDSEILLSTPLESAPYVDLTLDVMARFGVSAGRDGGRRFSVPGGQAYKGVPFTVEGDYSQAAFFLVAGVLGCDCACAGLEPASRQGDKRIVDILRACGAHVLCSPDGMLTARPGALSAQTVDVSDIPDLVPPLAALFCFCEGTSRIVNAGRLRLKESDRLEAVAGELNRLGARIAVEGDALTVTGVRELRGGTMSARGDHRIAMMGAVAAIRSRGPVCIEGAGCVSKSYPGFWKDFEKNADRPLSR